MKHSLLPNLSFGTTQRSVIAVALERALARIALVYP